MPACAGDEGTADESKPEGNGPPAISGSPSDDGPSLDEEEQEEVGSSAASAPAIEDNPSEVGAAVVQEHNEAGHFPGTFLQATSP